MRKRDELLEAYEALDAQLSSALQQLSWTLALPIPHASNESTKNANPSSCAVADESRLASQRVYSTDSYQYGALHIMVTVGTSLTAPKARIVLQLDNFEIRPFGWREDAAASGAVASRNLGDSGNYLEDGVSELAERMANASLASENSCGEDDIEGEEISIVDSSLGSIANSSAERVPATPCSCSHDDEAEESDEAFEEYEVLSVPSSTTDASPFDAVSCASNGSVTIHVASGPLQTLPSGVKDASTSPSPNIPNIPESQQTPSSPGHIPTSSEAFIRRAERLIYKTLAAPPSAADDATNDDELPLSQTTVLIRAPRRFKHASFLPRQTYSKELDDALNRCLSPHSTDSSINGRGAKGGAKGTFGSKVKPEGIRVSCNRVAAAVETTKAGVSAEESVELTTPKESMLEDGCQGVDVGDEMIWWQWTGKLKGIGDELFGY